MSLQHYRLLYASSVRFPHFRISKTSVCDVISLSLYLFVGVFVHVCVQWRPRAIISGCLASDAQGSSLHLPFSALGYQPVPSCTSFYLAAVEHGSSLLHAKCFTAWAISPVYHSFDWAFHNKDARSLFALWLHLSWLLHTLKVNCPSFY